MATNNPSPPPRTARLVLLSPEGTLLGALPPVPVATPWWQDIEPVVSAVRERFRIDVTVLRLLETERDRPHGGAATYLAETTSLVRAEPWSQEPGDHRLRMPWARPGGPAADLEWARLVLHRAGLTAGAPRQVRTWNLSSLWRIPTGRQTAWLKIVPPFFAHEGAMLEALAGESVPGLLGHEGPRMLLAEIPGEDLHLASLGQLCAMVTLLVGIQTKWIGRTEELLALGLPDWRSAKLATAIGDVVARTAPELSAAEADSLTGFCSALPERFAAIAACGLPDTLVHGDFHPGNVRGLGDRLTLLDWGDSGIGHPLLDQPAFLERVPETEMTTVRRHWTAAWRAVLPHSDPERASQLLAPVAAARQATIYRKFLDAIEPSERVYHRADPALWLRRTVALMSSEP